MCETAALDSSNPVLDAAIHLADNFGIPIFPVFPADKSPVIADWPNKATTDLEQVTRWFVGSTYLIGMLTGPKSGWDALDVDPRNGGDQWLAKHEHQLPATRRQTTRSDGFHYFFRSQPGLRCSAGKIAPGVDIRAENGYVVAWFAHGLPLDDVPVAEWPEWLLAQAMARQSKAGGDVSLERRLPPSAAHVIALLNQMPNPLEASRDTYIEVALGTKGCLDALAEAGTITEDDHAAIVGAFVTWAERWEGNNGTDERAKWETDWSQRDAALAGWQTLDRVAGQLIPGYREQRAKDKFETAKLGDTGECDKHWRSMLLLTKHGEIRGCLANARIALTHDPELIGLFAYNEFTYSIAVTRRPPWVSPEQPFSPRYLKESDAINLACRWQINEGIYVSSMIAGQAILAVAEQQSFHPVRNYLDDLTWDGMPRIGTWLIDYLGVQDTPLHRVYCARLLIGAVARVMRPGEKVDTVPVLEGRQGLLKSTAVKIMAGEWFTDHMPDLTSKDAQLQLQGMWFIEFAEFDKLSKADVNHAKRFMSTATDRFRKPYGEVTENFPRQCMFVVTLNRGATGYLRDETGNRRYWPIACGVGWPDDQKIDVAALRRVRDQLWAEAVYRFRQGEIWWLDQHEHEQAQAESAAERLDHDPWHDLIGQFVEDKDEITTDGLLADGLGVVSAKDRNPQMLSRASRVLTMLGWYRCQVRVNGAEDGVTGAKKRRWVYRRNDANGQGQAPAA